MYGRRETILAWASKDLERTMSFIADDIVCDAPAGRIEGARAYRSAKDTLTGPILDQSAIFPDIANEEFQDNASKAIQRFLPAG